MHDYLATLNDKQREAVLHTEGPLLVLAGAGTGKTKTITYRILHLIKSGVSPENILAVTFTNKATTEMRERVVKLLEPYGDILSSSYVAERRNKKRYNSFPMIRTFHSLGVFLLREHYNLIGLPKSFTILDRDDSISILKRAMKICSIDVKEWEPRRILGMISHAKGKNTTAEQFNEQNNVSELASLTAQVWLEYERIKEKENALDFDDLLFRAYKLLHDNEDIRIKYQKLWKYIHIDEYQDTNTLQYDLMRLLIGPEENICVVGDSDQTIYTWRGAEMRNILHFEKDFPRAYVIILEKNYRSTNSILTVAQCIIEKNNIRFDKVLTATREQGNPVMAYQALNETDEAGWIVGIIKKLIGEDGVPPSEIAILFRTNFQSRVIEEACLYANIPYRVVGTRFFDRKEVKDVLSYLRLALQRNNMTDMSRIINYPRRGLGKVAIALVMAERVNDMPAKARASYNFFIEILDSIKKYAQEHISSETMAYVIQKSGIYNDLMSGSADDRERLANIKELVSYASRFDDLHSEDGELMPPSDCINFILEQIALMSDQDTLQDDNKNKQATALMTIHSAKGLEFEYVFITGLEQGLFPSDIEDIDKNRDPEEERRLMYVAITRAKEQLHLSYSQTRTIYGRATFQMPSEFLSDIPSDEVVWGSAENPISLENDGTKHITHYLEW